MEYFFSHRSHDFLLPPKWLEDRSKLMYKILTSRSCRPICIAMRYIFSVLENRRKKYSCSRAKIRQKKGSRKVSKKREVVTSLLFMRSLTCMTSLASFPGTWSPGVTGTWLVPSLPLKPPCERTPPHKERTQTFCRFQKLLFLPLERNGGEVDKRHQTILRLRLCLVQVQSQEE